MPDREKVIKALEYCTHSDDCLGCIHWQKVAKGEKCTVREDALALLKDQEAVKPKSKSRHGEYPQIVHRCGNCNEILYRHYKYCPTCGRSVKWE